MKRGQFSS